jgi:hypothetical protein
MDDSASGFRLPPYGKKTNASAEVRRLVRSVDGSRKALAAVIAVIAVTALAGCSSQTKLREAELSQLAEWLPGRYDNRDQAERDTKDGGAGHEALAIVIVPIYAPALGKYAFYSQEMAADDSRRVTAQRVIAFDVAADKRIVQGMYALTEPVRWRDAHLNPDLFKGLIPHQDVRPLPGCELVWVKEGERFTAANDPARCRMPSRITGGTVNLEVRAELAQGELAMSDRSYDADGRLVYGNAAEPFYRFVKRAD